MFDSVKNKASNWQNVAQILLEFDFEKKCD